MGAFVNNNVQMQEDISANEERIYNTEEET